MNIAFVVLPLIILTFSIFGGIHHIEEGYVGIYYQYEVLQKTLSEPGYHTMIPFITRYESI